MVKDSGGKLIVQKSEVTRLVVVEKNDVAIEVYDEELDAEGRWHPVGFVTVPRIHAAEMAACFAIHYDALLGLGPRDLSRR